MSFIFLMFLFLKIFLKIFYCLCYYSYPNFPSLLPSVQQFPIFNVFTQWNMKNKKFVGDSMLKAGSSL